MKIPVLLYHSISDVNSMMSLNVNIFENQIKYLKNNGYKSINFDEIDQSAKSKLSLHSMMVIKMSLLMLYLY